MDDKEIVVVHTAEKAAIESLLAVLRSDIENAVHGAAMVEIEEAV